MFPDIARDDVFRLETARLWLRWPRACDAAGDRTLLQPVGSRALHRAHSRIPIPRARPSASSTPRARATARGRDLTLVLTPIRGKREAIGASAWSGAAQTG